MKMGISNLFYFLIVCSTMVRANIISDDEQQQRVAAHCGHTRYPSLCVGTLTELKGSKETDVLVALVNRTISETQLPDFSFQKHSSHPESQLTQTATGYCQDLMALSLRRLKQAAVALEGSPGKNKQDIQTWLSAVLTFQETCKEAADAHAPTDTVMARLSDKMKKLTQLSSISLAIANRLTGEPEGKSVSSVPGRRLSDEHMFPNWLSAKARKLLQSDSVTPNAVVAQDGSGDFKTISEAIQAATGDRFVIYVKSGVYKEKLLIDKDGISLLGDGKDSTIISGAISVAGGATLQGTPTVTITGDDFIARDIRIENTAGPQGQQAVALFIASDRSALFKCGISGYQDTLYAHSLRQFYRECDIYGTIDFIFGNAAAVFQSCNVILRQPGSKGAYNVILAHGRTDPGQNTGFAVQNCMIIADSSFLKVKDSYSSYLGRPWREYARSVIMQSTIDSAIAPIGWVEWPGASGFSQTVYFAEHANIGLGAATSNRVQWPGFHVIGKEEATKFTVANFISGTSWLPSTGVTFISGLQ